MADDTSGPANVAAEAALLGALLITNDLLDALPVPLAPEHFAEPIHARLFERIVELRGLGQVVTPVTLKAYFEDDEALRELGGVGYLAQLTGDSQGLLAPRELAEQILELAQRRTLRSRLSEAMRACGDFAVSADELSALASEVVEVATNRSGALRATPYGWPDPAAIPQRPWIMGRWLLRRAITVLVAPGAHGKSTWIASAALALASGRPLLGKQVWERPQRAWLWNLEDDQDELDRAIAAAALGHAVHQDDCGDRLFVDSGLSGRQLCTAIEDREGLRLLRPEIDALTRELIARRVDVLIVDPFVSSHRVSENNNGSIDAVAKSWGRVAAAADCAIVLPHHAHKLAGQRVTAEASRGAVALVNAARIALAFNRMTAEEAEAFGVQGDDERRLHFSVVDDKHNRSRPKKADWFRLQSVELPNGDAVGAAMTWQPPDAFDGVTLRHLYAVQRRIAEGEWRENHQAGDWAGKAVAEVLGLDPVTDRRRIIHLLGTWIGTGALKVVERPDGKRMPRKFVEVGAWAVDGSATPDFGGAGRGGAGEAPPPPHHPPSPCKGGGGGAGGAPADFASEADGDWGGEFGEDGA